ncbi:Intramolecular chaperone auto-processing domain [Phytophthora cactorum]|nr:Intramolecular chaperone auto-processing domain [Phytophthora cactorum]
MTSSDIDATGFSFIDAKLSSPATSVFTVDGSGGGAIISDKAADATSTLVLSNTAGSGFTGSLLSVSATASDKLYTIINGKASGTSVFKVAASGLTTIAGQGSGGAAISDSGTTANTLTLTNSATSFSQAVLAMTSSDTDGTGFSFIDAKAGGSSAFKVDATGATTIAAGGLTVTKGGATIADNTDINTLKLSNTFATLSNTVLDMTTTNNAGFSFIDAKVGSPATSVFKVTATGATTIAAGVTIASSGLTVTSGGLTVTKGGATIADNTDMSTLTLTNTFATLTNTMLAMTSSDTDGTGFSFIDAKAGGSSAFKVDATGATTIAAGGLTVTKGGATIADNTDINTLKLSNTFATLSNTVLDMTTTNNAGFSFIDAKVGSPATSVFKVTATGATTIAAGVTIASSGLTVTSGGLTVTKGGATIADNTDMSTLTLTNTFATLTNTMLAMTSSDTDGTGFSFIDAKAGGSSAFKVDATGATTIAAGGLTVTKGGATIADNTDINTLKLSNTFATLSNTVLDMTTTNNAGFSFIDAKVGSPATSVFKVTATGATTIAAGVTIASSGLTGGATIADNTDMSTLTLTNTFATLTNTMLAMTSSDTDGTGFSFIDAKAGSPAASVFKVDGSGLTTITAGGLKVSAGGATVAAGGLKVSNGGATITAGGLTVTDGGATISRNTDAATLTLSNTFATLSNTVLDMTTTNNAGGSPATSVFKVTATGATTIAAGVTIASSGLTVTSGGLTVTKGGATIADNTDMSTLTLTNTFATLTNTMLAMTSSDTDGTGFSFIDAKAGGSSAFKVDATGATTIAAGGLTVTKGGATIADNTDINTLKLSNTFATLSNTVLDMTTTNNAGFSFIDAKVGSPATSVFKVTATGATTIAAGVTIASSGLTVTSGGLTVTKGGATIADNTDMSTLTLTNTFATLTNTMLAMTSSDTDGTGFSFIDAKAVARRSDDCRQHGHQHAEALQHVRHLSNTVLDMTTTNNAGFSFIDAKVGSPATSVFKVTATGATTIAAGVTIASSGLTVTSGGLTVTKGGATIADNTDMSTLTLTNTFATLTNTMLAMTSSDTDGTGFSFIDAKAGGSSAFKVDATGATTIAAGGLTVTKGGATIADNTDINTLKLSNTFATLSNTVLDMTTTNNAGFSFIDAKVGSPATSVFKVTATGATTIAAGVTIASSGLTVTSGGLTVTKGGATIADNTDMSTLTLTNTFATLTNTMLAMTSSDTDGTGFSFIDAKAGGSSAFKGGATIADNTDINTLKLSNTFATLSNTVLDMTTTNNAGFSFIDAKVGSPATSVFKVTATGATTIAAGVTIASSGLTVTSGGLTVTKGGATIADNTDMSTLTLTNTFATLTNTMLAMTSSDTDGTGFSFIDAKAGGSSAFKVDATGATTIAAGGLTVTKGGATIADNTDINTLKLSNTFATLSNTVLDMTTTNNAGFSFIDAKVGSPATSVFKVTATGATTIAAGVTIASSGLTVTSGGLTVTKGGATIADNTDMSGVAGRVRIQSGRIRVDYHHAGGLKVSAGGATVAAGGLKCHNGELQSRPVADLPTRGPISEHRCGTLTLSNTFATLSNTVLDMTTTNNRWVAATSVFKVTATGATTIAAGVTIASSGLTVTSGGLTVTKGGATIADNTDMSTLTLTNTFATLTNTMLAMTSSDTDGTGFSFIDAKAGGSSAFKVDATGATTIAAGGLTVTKGGATIADNTDINTLKLSNTFATLSNTVLDMTTTNNAGFSFIDAKVGSPATSVFKVTATGATTIAAGVTIASSGLTVTSGGLTVTKGGATIADNTDMSTLTLTNTFATLTNTMLAMTSSDTDAPVDGSGLTTITAGGLKVSAGGATVAAGGLKVSNGGATITAGGLTVTDGGATISRNTDAATLTLSNTFATLSNTVLDMTTTNNAGFSFIDAKVGSPATSVFKVTATGATTIAAGVTIASSGLTVTSGGLTVTKGGATIADNTDMSTLTLTNTFATLTNTMLAMTSSDTDGTGFSFIDAKAGGSSAFKVDATGATTIAAGGLTVTKGGATIADNTDINTLKLSNTFATLSNTVLDMTTTNNAGGSPATSVFKVTATGATTIAAGVTIASSGLTVTSGGLTVTKGGATIADNTDMSTLTLTNTFATLTNTMLAMTSSDTDGTGFSFIDAKAGGSSAFKVDATGATTIAAGGLTVTKGGATIADNTDINTLKLSNTFATLSNTVLDMTTTNNAGFSFIDAKVGSPATSVFKVTATGATTIAAGVTIASSGLTVTSGRSDDCRQHGLSTLTLTNTFATLTNTMLAMTSSDTDGTGFSFIDAKAGSPAASVFKVDATGATTITAASITGGITAVDTGVTVTTGGARIYDTSTTADTLKVKNTATGTFSGALLSLDTGTLTSGFSLISAGVAGGSPKFSVAASGLTTIAAGGLSVTGGVTITNTGLTVTTGGASITDTGTATSTLTLTNSAGTFDKALLSMDSTATSGFSLINAMVGGTPQFTVAAGGATTIASGGLSIKGGVTVVDTGVTVSAGDVLISSNTQSAATNSGALVVTGGVGIGRDLRCAGTIYGTDLSSSQEIIRQLHPVTYEWRRDQFPSRNFPAGVFHGFLADEVEQILPDLVEEDADGWKSLNYIGIVPHLVRAVQEMQGQLEASQVQMTRMQHQIDALLAARA